MQFPSFLFFKTLFDAVVHQISCRISCLKWWLAVLLLISSCAGDNHDFSAEFSRECLFNNYQENYKNFCRSLNLQKVDESDLKKDESPKQEAEFDFKSI